MNQTKKLTDGAMMTVMYLVLLVASFFIPYLAFVIYFLLPVPFIIYAYRYDWKPAIIMFAAAAILASLFATVFSLPMTITTALGGVMIGTAMHRKTPGFETLARGTVGFVIGLLMAFMFVQTISGVNFSKEFDQVLEESISNAQQFAGKMGGASSEMDKQLDLLKQQFEAFKLLVPAMLVIVGLFYAWISQLLGYKIINRVERKQFRFPPFRQMRFPVAIVWIYFFALVITLFGPGKQTILYIGVQNVLFLAGTLMVLQGLSFVFFYAHEKKMPKALPIIVIILTVFFSTLLLPLVRILGIIDIGFNLRNMMEKKK
ncbi:YybS family protein [Virgibacillus halophilus]|uniref:YybS family protein n=1 Tax=Tigheibacillus halophilus TaxID=361280 RepID=A0ABU5C7Z7_9BACI|nr:YybS family protein [Virgibacillus halophilus]